MKELLCFLTLLAMSSAAYAQDKPNMLIIWGDDIGQSNISAYTRGMISPTRA
jgi:arylsulfatase